MACASQHAGGSMTFRHWCRLMWQEHCNEVAAWTGNNPQYLSEEYFEKYKWWLRREYRATGVSKWD